MTSRIQTAVTALSKNLKAIERTAKRNPLDAPMRLSQLVLRGALQHNHNLRLSPFELKATITGLLEQHPDWFRYQRSLFYRPTTQAIAKLTPEELEQSHRECNEHRNKWMGERSEASAGQHV